MTQTRVIIQCAASKTQAAGSLHSRTGRRVKFVGRPTEAPTTEDWIYARPDDLSDVPGQSWRQEIERYNQRNDNPLGLLKAYRLYSNPVYADLVDCLGAANVFILSAGWGLVNADYLLPDYDITFSKSAEHYKRRQLQDEYHDFCHLPCTGSGTLVSFCGKDYLALFDHLTARVGLDKVVFYATGDSPEHSVWRTIHFETKNFRKWPYDCARKFLKGEIPIYGDKVAAIR